MQKRKQRLVQISTRTGQVLHTLQEWNNKAKLHILCCFMLYIIY